MLFTVVFLFSGLIFWISCAQPSIPVNDDVSVQFDGAGQTNGTPPKSVKSKSGHFITIPYPVELKKTGYTFCGWTSDITLGPDAPIFYPFPFVEMEGKPLYNGQYRMAIENSNIILHAYWVANFELRKLAGRWKVIEKTIGSNSPVSTINTSTGLTTAGYFLINGSKLVVRSSDGAIPVPMNGKTAPVWPAESSTTVGTVDYTVENNAIIRADTKQEISFWTDRDTNNNDTLILILQEGDTSVKYTCNRELIDGFSFVPLGNDNAMITKFTAPDGVRQDLTIPEMILGLTVSAIGIRAFDHVPLNSLTFTAGSQITSIGDYAFNSCALTGVLSIPPMVVTIGTGAFACNKLTRIAFPDNNSLRDSVITPDSGTETAPVGITGITLFPPGVEDPGNDEGRNKYTRFFPGIGKEAFANNSTPAILDSFGAGPDFSIGEGAFLNAGLTGTLIIPDRVKDAIISDRVFPGIGANAFAINALTFLTIGSGVETLGNGAFRNNKLKSVTIPPTIKKIGNTSGSAYGVFENNTLQGTLTIPTSVEEIGGGAFAGISGNSGNKIALIRWESPSKVESIGAKAFCYNKLSSLDIPDSVKTIGDSAFVGNDITILELDFAKCLETIGDDAFKNNDITKLVIPATIRSIGAGAFSQNMPLSLVLFETDETGKSGITEIKANTFEADSSLISVIIPRGVEKIGPDAFFNCTKLNSVDIPGVSGSSITIEKRAFYNTALRKVIIRASVVTLPNSSQGSVFGANGDSFFTKYANQGRTAGVYTYGKSANPPAWTYARAFAITGNDFTGLTAYLNSLPNSEPARVYLTGVDIKNGVQLDALKAALTRDSILDLSGSGTAGDTPLTPDTALISLIRNWSGGRIKGLILPDAITDIGAAFSQCSSLTSITIPDNVIAIGREAFKGASALTGIIIPAAVASLDDRAFSSCTSLREITFERTLRPDFKTKVFEGCTQLSSIRVPAAYLSNYTSYLTPEVLTSLGIPFAVVTGY
jgi:hypothetical protein